MEVECWGWKALSSQPRWYHAQLWIFASVSHFLFTALSFFYVGFTVWKSKRANILGSNKILIFASGVTFLTVEQDSKMKLNNKHISPIKSVKLCNVNSSSRSLNLAHLRNSSSSLFWRRQIYFSLSLNFSYSPRRLLGFR